MTVEDWIAYLRRKPRKMEIVIGDSDPMSDCYLLAEPYEPAEVHVTGHGEQKCIVVGMQFAKREVHRLRDPKPELELAR